MAFKDIQTILISAFTIISKFLDKPRISNGGGALKYEPEKKGENQAN